MIAMTLAEVAAAVGGVIAGAEGERVRVTGPAFVDSRAPEPGGLFAAFAGERADGHEHAGAALAGGAAAVLGSRPTAGPTVVVPDVQAALGLLAARVLRRLRGDGALRVVALTGSQGKTSAKDLLAAVLGDLGPTVATRGSFNNELGLPLTVLRADPSTRFLVLEMGARGIGHIAELCAIAPPDIGMVLNVGTAHLGEFGSQSAIARAKGEIVEALSPSGVAVLNLDDPLVASMSTRTKAAVWTFGQAVGADLRLYPAGADEFDRAAFDMQFRDSRAHVQLRIPGAHQAVNAAAAAAAALALGAPLEGIAGSLGRVEALSPWRMELRERADGLVVINDAYNANPESMRAGLDTLAGIGARSGRPTLAILGEMRELGDDAETAHEDIGRHARERGIDKMIVVGEAAAGLAREFPGAVRTGSVAEAIALARENVGGGEVVLVKASRAARLERVAEALLDSGSDEEEVAGP